MIKTYLLRVLSAFAFIFLLGGVIAEAEAGNDASFYAQDVPTTMVAGQTYGVAVWMTNTGTTTWVAGQGFSLGSQNPQDNTTWGLGRVDLYKSMGPGTTYGFGFQVTAPTTPGTYNFQWRMVQEGVEWFGGYSTNVVITVTAPPPPTLKNDAQFISQSVPAKMFPDRVYPVSVTMRNTGTTTWTPAGGFYLGSQNPENNVNFGLKRVAPATNVAPGQSYTFNFNVNGPIAPAGQAYNYYFQWRMVEEYKEWFGEFTPNTLVIADATVMPPVLALSCTSYSPSISPSPASASCTLSNTGPSAASSVSYSSLPGMTVSGPTGYCGSYSTCGTVTVVTSSAVGTYSGTLVATPNTGTAASAPINLTVAQPAVNNAQFVEQTLPTSPLVAGQRYSVTVKMQNNGSTTWPAGTTYALGSQNPTDNLTWGMGRVRLDSNVYPGQAYIFKFDVTAPDPGTYNFQWKMIQEGVEWFGALTPNMSLTVNPPHPSVAWTGVNDALGRGDKATALTYFAEPEKYDALFTALGANMRSLSSSMSGFEFTEVAANYATAVVNQVEPSGTVSQHYITFIYKDGRWQIVDF
jgi:hypothetical protein